MRLMMLMALAMTATLGQLAVAADGHNHSRTRWSPCPHCSEPCFPSVSKSKTTKHCFAVDCKPICIPAITFPWQKCNGKCDGASCQDKGCQAKRAGKDGKGCSGKNCGGKGKCPAANCQTPAKCGRVRYVKVLRKHEYECSSCKVTWSVDRNGGDKAKAQPTEAPLPADTASDYGRESSRVIPVRVGAGANNSNCEITLRRPSVLRSISD